MIQGVVCFWDSILPSVEWACLKVERKVLSEGSDVNHQEELILKCTSGRTEPTWPLVSFERRSGASNTQQG